MLLTGRSQFKPSMLRMNLLVQRTGSTLIFRQVLLI